jgi:hypothetical protein
MTYLQALRLMAKAYKAAKGVMPKGIDLLKMKMKARQKAIDSKKVIEFPKERITNPFKPRPEPYNKLINPKSDTGIKLGKVREGLKKRETEAQMLARMKRQNKESVARLKEKKDLGDKLKDLPDDIPDMADGGVASAIKKIKKRFGKKSITTGDKIKRPGNRQLFDDFKKRNKFIVGGRVRRNVTPQPRDPKLQNLINVYESNPTLQSSMSIDDYLMQAYRPTTPTTEELATGITTQLPQPAAINPVKPIIPIPESDSGGITTIQPRAPKEPLTFRESMAQLNLQRGAPVKEEEISFFDKIKQFSPTYQFMKAGRELKDRGQQAIEDFFAAREAAKAAEVARIARQNLAASMGSDAGPGEGAGTFGASVNEATGARGPGTGFSDYS